MPYVLSKRPTFTYPVKVVEPGNAVDGAVIESSFVAEFVLKDREEMAAYLRERKPDEVVLKEMLVGWFGLQDGAGAELPFNEQHRDSLLKVQYALAGLMIAFVEGSTTASRKN